MEILERPATFSAVGGRLPNPVVYRISSTSAYVQAFIYKADGTFISTVKASTRNGVALIDVSAFLRAQMNLSIPAGAQIVEPAQGSSISYFCSFEDPAGNAISDKANVRYAVAAALPYGVSDYAAYTI